MSEQVKIRIRDFYENAMGNEECIYVSQAVYEELAGTFRRQAHAERMRDLRHMTAEGYTEGETEDLMAGRGETLEEQIIRRTEIETLQKAMQSLTEVQRERLHFYFYEGLSGREIAELQGINQNAVWKSIQYAIRKLKKFFD